MNFDNSNNLEYYKKVKQYRQNLEIENISAFKAEKERLLNSASYFDLRGMLSLTNLAQEASSLAAVHINSLLYILVLNQQGI